MYYIENYVKENVRELYNRESLIAIEYFILVFDDT